MKLPLLLATALVATPASADFSGFVEPAVHSQYRFGGLPFTDTPIQQTKFVGCRNTNCVAFIPTYSFSTDELIETDYAFLKIVPREKSTWVFGFGHYTFPGAPSTNEIFAEYERGPWKTKFFFDFDQGDNGWVLETNYKKQIGPLETTLTAGLNHKYYLFDEDEPASAVYANITLAIPKQVNKWNIKPYITKQIGQGPLDNKLWAGVIAKYDF